MEDSQRLEQIIRTMAGTFDAQDVVRLYCLGTGKVQSTHIYLAAHEVLKKLLNGCELTMIPREGKPSAYVSSKRQQTGN